MFLYATYYDVHILCYNRYHLKCMKRHVGVTTPGCMYIIVCVYARVCALVYACMYALYYLFVI